MFLRLGVEPKEVRKPRAKDEGVELLLSSSVDPVEEKPLISELGQNKANNKTKCRNILLHYYGLYALTNGGRIQTNITRNT